MPSGTWDSVRCMATPQTHFNPLWDRQRHKGHKFLVHANLHSANQAPGLFVQGQVNLVGQSCHHVSI